MPSLTVENYVKAIFRICTERSGRPATTGQIASDLNVSPGTVTSMLKTLSEAGLATYTPYEGVQLTESGNHLALRILRRHRLVELFLSQSLGLSWDQVHDDAEELEHVVSDFLVERIDRHLGSPQFDPHGDPIPGPDGTLAPRHARPLAGCPPGFHFRLAQVTDQSAEFLRYLTRSGLALDVEGEVAANDPDADVVTVLVRGEQLPLSRQAAGKLLVSESHAPHIRVARPRVTHPI